MGLIVGLIVGVLLALPLLPLLRAADLPFGQAAAGIALIGVAVVAFQSWSYIESLAGVPARELSRALLGAVGAAWPVYLTAAIVAALGAVRTTR